VNAMSDLDRVLADWLHEGPSRAPDRPVQVALDHARSHPRRRDPLAFLRTDPMASRTVALVYRPALFLAVLGLLLAALAVATVGSRRDPMVVPPISASPSPTASPTPPGPTPARSLPVGFADEHENTISVNVVDQSGTLETARAIRPADPTPDPQATVPPGGLLVWNQDPRSLRVTWGDGACATSYDLTIDTAARLISVSRPECSGDALGASRDLLLVFVTPIDAADVSSELISVP
jgi:hypothetical protein